MQAPTDSGDPSQGEIDIDIDLVAETLEVLEEMLDWRLAEVRWPRVRQTLATIEGALGAQDMELLAKGLSDLELCSPSRWTRIASEPVTSAPDQVREVHGRLVHELTDTRSSHDKTGADDAHR